MTVLFELGNKSVLVCSDFTVYRQNNKLTQCRRYKQAGDKSLFSQNKTLLI